MDQNALLLTLYTGASIVGSEAVKEATKEAYKSLKSVIAKLCGTKVKYATDALEDAPTSDEARAKLQEAIGAIPEPDVAEVSNALTVLQNALKADPAAITAAETFGRIRLKVVSGGNVVIEDIDGVRSFDVDANAAQDFTFSKVKMAGGPAGN